MRTNAYIRRTATALATSVGAILVSAGLVSAATTLGTNSITTTGTLQVDGNATFDTNTMFVDAANNRVGIGDATPAALFTVGTSDAFQVSASGSVTTVGGFLAASTATNADKLMLAANATGSTTFTGTLTVVDLTAARTWTLPDLAGSIQVTAGTLTIAASKTLAVSNTLTLSGTDGTTITFQGSDTYVGRATTDTLTNKTLRGAFTLFDTATTNADTLKMVPQASGVAATYAGIITSADLLSVDRTWTFPDADGTVTVLGNSTTGTGNIVRSVGPSLGSFSATGNVQIFGSGTSALQLGGATPPVHLASFQQTAPSSTPAGGFSSSTVATGSSDTKGMVTIATTDTDGGSVAVTFTVAYSNNAPVCVISPATVSAAADISKVFVTSSTTALTINYATGSSGASNQAWNYHCIE